MLTANENKKEPMIGKFTVPQYKNFMRVNNAAMAAMDTVMDTGLEQCISTTAKILPTILDAYYYQLDGQKLSDFVPIEVGYGAYSRELVQFAVKPTGADFKSWLINPTAGGFNLDANVDSDIEAQRYHNNFIRAAYSLTKEGIEMAAKATMPFNLYEIKEKARAKAFYLGLQEAWFLGLNDGKSYGLLNQPSGSINTSFMNKSLSKMTNDEFKDWVGTLRGLFNSATKGILQFDRLLMPQDDYFALDTVFGEFGLTRRQILENVVKANNGKIVYTKYNETAGTNGNPRYALYKYDEDLIQGFIPLPYTPWSVFPQGSLDVMCHCMAQFVTPVSKVNNTLLYLDVIPQA